MEKSLKKKVLLFTDWYYPAYKAGGPVQSCQNIVRTVGDKFQFYIFTSDRDLGEKQAYEGIETNKWMEGRNREYIRYNTRGSIYPATIRRIMKEVEPDLVYFNSMFSLYYTLLPLLVLQISRYRGKVVLAPRGMLHSGALLRKGMKKKIFLHSFRMSGWPRKLVFHATDYQEQRDISKFFPEAVKAILAENIPNEDPAPVIVRSKKNGELNMVFISRVHPKKNLLFLIEQLKGAVYNGHIKLDIYGECDELSYETKCRQLADSLPANIKVTFKGALPHVKVFEVLHQYHLFVLPTLGENFGHAIYESLSSGTPVLISTETPWRDLEAYGCGMDLPLDQPNKYQAAIRQFLEMDMNEYAKWASKANSYASSFLNNFNFVSKYTALFQ